MDKERYFKILDEVVLFANENGYNNTPFKKVLPIFFKSKSYGIETQYNFFKQQNLLSQKAGTAIKKDLKFIKGLEFIPVDKFESEMFLLYGWDYIVFHFYKQLKYFFQSKKSNEYRGLFKERLLELNELAIDNNREEIIRINQPPKKSISRFVINEQNIKLLIDRYTFLIQLEIKEEYINKRAIILIEVFKNESGYDSVYSKRVTHGHTTYEKYGITIAYAKKLYNENNTYQRRTSSRTIQNINTYNKVIKLLVDYPEAKKAAEKELLKIKEPI